jgi:hypothetical protein
MISIGAVLLQLKKLKELQCPSTADETLPAWRFLANYD